MREFTPTDGRAGLCETWRRMYRRGGERVVVHACAKCIKAAVHQFVLPIGRVRYDSAGCNGLLLAAEG